MPSACTCATPDQRVQDRDIDFKEGDDAGIDSGVVHRRGGPRLRLPPERKRRSPPGPHLPVRRERPPADGVRRRRSDAGHRRRDRHRRERGRPRDDDDARRRKRRAEREQGRDRGADAHIPTRDHGRVPCGAIAAPEPADGAQDAQGEALRDGARKREAQTPQYQANKSEIAWGHQVRSYVLAPYRLVKDLRTSHETGNVDGVLDGALETFIEAYSLGGSRWDAEEGRRRDGRGRAGGVGRLRSDASASNFDASRRNNRRPHLSVSRAQPIQRATADSQPSARRRSAASGACSARSTTC